MNSAQIPLASPEPPFTTRFIRRLFTWRTFGRGLVALAALATLIALFYTEENWRGKRAWEKVRRQMETQGVSYDWNTLIPAPVRDEKNVFKAPRMKEWFVGRGSNDLSGRLDYGKRWGFESKSHILFAEVTVAAGEDPGPAAGETVWQLDDPANRVRLRQLLDRVFGTNATGCQNIFFVIHSNAVTPAHIVLQTHETPTVAQLEAIFTSPSPGLFHVVSTARSNVFQVNINAPMPASDYLAWSDPFEKDFDLVREALKRPYAQFVCDYSPSPADIDIPNFVTSRAVEQTLAQRAQCHLMLGEPDQALRDITLMHDLCRIFEGAPTGKPMTLVGSMINVAVAGLYANTIADSLRFHEWNDAQLSALEQQCGEIHLAVPLAESMRDEQIFSFHTINTYSRAELVKLFDQIHAKPSLMRLLKYAPKGWLYQGMAIHGPLFRQFQSGIDVEARTVSPHKVDETGRAAREQTEHITRYNFIGVLAMPSYVKAIQVFASNQTSANEAAVACALERYHLAHGEYPETLDALTPQFLGKLPHDLIGGQPLKYHRTNDPPSQGSGAASGQFVLYSIGWNESDDGGQTALDKDGRPDLAKGDWIWSQPTR